MIPSSFIRVPPLVSYEFARTPFSRIPSFVVSQSPPKSSSVVLLGKDVIINTIHSYRLNRTRMFLSSYSSSPDNFYYFSTLSTYILFLISKYWQYPGNKYLYRPDVEIVGTCLALLWNLINPLDFHILILLWVVGGASHLSSRIFLAQNNSDLSARLHCGVHLCGQIVYILVIYNLVTLFFL